MSKLLSPRRGFSRREFFKGLGGLAAIAALPTFEVFAAPSSRLSGELKILLWSHFVPNHDVWFDPFAKAWGEANGVTVTVDHINSLTFPRRLPPKSARARGTT